MNTTATWGLLLAAALPAVAHAGLAATPGGASTNLHAVAMRFAADADIPPAPPRLVPVTMHELNLHLEPAAADDSAATRDQETGGWMDMRSTRRGTPPSVDVPAPVEVTRSRPLLELHESGDGTGPAAGDGAAWGWLAEDVQRIQAEEALADEQAARALATWDDDDRDRDADDDQVDDGNKDEQKTQSLTWKDDAPPDTESSRHDFGAAAPKSSDRADRLDQAENRNPDPKQDRDRTDSGTWWETTRRSADRGEASAFELPAGQPNDSLEGYTLPTPAAAPISGLQDDAARAPFGAPDDDR